jgi:nitrate reductase gamma subunit
VVGAIVGLASIFVNMPMVVLVVLGSIAGAVGVVGGLMLVFGSLNTADFSRGDFVDTVNNNWFWYVLLLVLMFFGVYVQMRQRLVMQRSIQESWYAEAR